MIRLESIRLARGYLYCFHIVALIAIATIGSGCGGNTSGPAQTEGDSGQSSGAGGWDTNVASLPKWTPKKEMLEQLGDEVIFGSYALRPPKGYELSPSSDKLGADVKRGTFCWKKKERTPALWLDLMFRSQQEWNEGPAARIKGDLARVKTLCEGDAHPAAVEFGNVNGLGTARSHFDATGKTDDKERKYKGYQSITSDGMTSIDILVIVSDADDAKTLEILEASMLTLRKR